MTTKPVSTGQRSTLFRGFKPLTANFIYCPNQFFDVCLPRFSRGTVRLVAYVLHKTLEWLDENGTPIQQNIRVSYADLIDKAGISRGAIRGVVDEAIAGGFICCTMRGRADAKGHNYQSAQYMLRWDAESNYTTDPTRFRGFYANEGNRSPIPAQFFSHIVRRETHGVVKAVGTVLRHTVGYQNQFGGRRSNAPLPLSFIQKYAKIKSSDTAVRSVGLSVEKGYICRVEEGEFSPDRGIQKPARYAPKWLPDATIEPTGSEIEAGADNRFRNRSSGSSRIEAADRFEKRSSRKTSKKHTYKQQNVVVDNSVGYEVLVKEGIGKSTARKLSESATLEEITKQIEWLDFRNPENRPAMLRTAIEEGWSVPEAVAERQQQKQSREREERERAERLAHETRIAMQKKERQRRLTGRLARWKEQTKGEQRRWTEMALEQAPSGFRKRSILDSSLDDPAREVLEVMALAIAEPAGESS